MLLLVLVFSIYYTSMNFMRKYAGRQEPFWGIGFVLLGFVLELLFIYSAVFFFSSTNKLIINILAYLFAIPITIGISYLVSKNIQKRNIRNSSKGSSINFKWVSILSFIFGLIIVFLVAGLTGKVDGFLVGILIIMLFQGLGLHKRNLAVSNLSINELKNQPYVLFLREFKADGVFAFQEKRDFLFRKQIMTIEQFLRKFISEKTPFVALGNPEDYLPTLGCQKAYLSDESWQEQIKEYIDNASLIIALEGVSKGLQWELEYIFQNTDHSKVKLITWPEGFITNKSFKKKFGDNYTGNEVYKKIGFEIDTTDSGQVISFNKQWKAVKYENYDSLSIYVK